MPLTFVFDFLSCGAINALELFLSVQYNYGLFDPVKPAIKEKQNLKTQNTTKQLSSCHKICFCTNTRNNTGSQ